MDPEFLIYVSAARKKLALKHLLAATFVAGLLAAYGLITYDVSNPLVLIFRLNNILSMVFLVITLAMSYLSTAFVHNLDIPMTMICVHIIAYNSMTYARLQALTSPAFDDLLIESDSSDEFECVLLCYMCISVVCHFNIVDVKAALVIAILAPLSWCMQVTLLGTPLANVRTIAVVYWMLSGIAFFGLKRHQAAVLLLKWEIHGFGKRKQLEATCGIMEFLCDCVLSLDHDFILLDDSPKLSTLLLRSTQTSLKGQGLIEFLGLPSDITFVKDHMAEGPSIGMLPVCLKEGPNRHIHCHAYYSRFQDEMDRTCYVLGLLENQEGESYGRTPIFHAEQNASGESSGESESETENSYPKTLCEVLASSDADGMTFMIHPESLQVVLVSETLQEFIGNSSENMRLNPNAAKVRLFREKIRPILAKFVGVDKNLGGLDVRLLDEDRSTSDRFLRIEKCSLSGIHCIDSSDQFSEGSSISEVFEISLHGKTELRRKLTKANRGNYSKIIKGTLTCL